MSFVERLFGKKEGLPGVPEFKGVKKPSKIDDRKTDLELAKELDIKKLEDVTKPAEDFDIDVEEDEDEDITGEVDKLKV